MNAKEYLSQAFRLDRKINNKLRHTVSLREMATQGTRSIHAQRVSGTDKHSPMENAITRLVDLECEIDADIDRLVDLKRELAAFISQVDNQVCKMLLELRYLEGNTWEDVAEQMGYDLRSIYWLHGKTLQELDLRLNKQELA
ncbi:hypothetical protein SOV_35890 [Sporomusa ovata DSM 2662]|uniref:DUF1492 domain-containing protein n=1 Tax=Sporomusa ovata TaxID=2378 RepID=A0A0U1L6E2_9FIRM|nr:DUF1492 domain-containing protein [Sporomusa ovata]EQB24738.1 hypothetical protein SOV_6c01520 [Sporomusa ovata DSM 2662]CQR75085.1 hypothetical protein SpAn4DRAFT_4449 [Sporomusa ovata]